MTTTKIRNSLLHAFLLTLLVACGNKSSDNNATPIPETPKALQEDKIDIKSYSRSNDLVDELYQELVDKTPALKQLEDEIDAINPKPGELSAKFNTYESKSNSYYSSANYKAMAITDSLLRTQIVSLLSASSKSYSAKTSVLSSLIDQFSKNSSKLNDHHSVLKIVLTLPIIEKYQNENKPDKKEFKALIKEQENLIKQTDSLTP